MWKEGTHGISVFQLPLEDRNDGPIAERAGSVVRQRGHEVDWSRASFGLQTSSVRVHSPVNLLVVITTTKGGVRVVVPEVVHTTTIAPTTVTRVPVLLSFTETCLFSFHFFLREPGCVFCFRVSSAITYRIHLSFFSLSSS